MNELIKNRKIIIYFFIIISILTLSLSFSNKYYKSINSSSKLRIINTEIKEKTKKYEIQFYRFHTLYFI